MLNRVLIFPALLSVVAGVHNGVLRSGDFQWSGAHLFAAHTDPFQQQMNHDPQHLILAAQVPNYLHELYVVLWPIGLLSFRAAAIVWVMLNLLFAAMSVFLLGRLFDLGSERTLLLGMLFALGTPFRVAVGNGQQCLLVLLLMTLTLAATVQRRETGANFAWLYLGLSYLKYSFSPIFVFFFVLRRRWITVLLSLIPPTLGWLFFSYWVHRSPFLTAFEPLIVSRTGVSRGDGDLATLLPLLSSHGASLALPLALLLSASLAYGIYRQQKEWMHAFAILSVADLALLPHLTYDYVFLLFPTAWLLSARLEKTSRPRTISFVCLFALSYVFKLVPAGQTSSGIIASILVHIVLLTVLGLSLLQAQTRNIEPLKG